MKIKERFIQNLMIVKLLKMIMTKDALKMEEKNSKNIHHVPKCMSCHKAIVVINGRAHCFHDNIYVYIYIICTYIIYYILYSIYIYYAYCYIYYIYIICFPILLIDSVYKIGENCYRAALLEEYKYAKMK